MASVAESVFRKDFWKSVTKSWKVPKEPVSRTAWVHTAAQLLAVPLVMKERAYPTFLLSVE